ncbi:hypothetical protein [Sporosalibacterium faouarense]|uniref:hypothetical protein n=1 Tax=Sporosalibacterium faouarense TaxID=516123 RepID=UPI00141C1998|nr:hypothetical protein [Sporosalibacterium faouarense]MTI48572.1 hypothetical protein [Bacillota bacterium]
MLAQYKNYIEEVLEIIETDPKTKEKIRQSLTEHVDAIVERYGSLASSYLDEPEKVAMEFMDNLKTDNVQKDVYEYPWWLKKRGIHRKISKKKILNIPLYHITDGYNPETGEFEVAKGFFAIGPVALGVVSCGGAATGIISFGGISLGLLLSLGGVSVALGGAIGGFAMGGLFALGGAAISYGLAFGGYASGHVAIGDVTEGKYFFHIKTGEGNAIEWFKRYMPYLTRYFK